jgi:hypothetical protein
MYFTTSVPLSWRTEMPQKVIISAGNQQKLCPHVSDPPSPIRQHLIRLVPLVMPIIPPDAFEHHAPKEQLQLISTRQYIAHRTYL